MKKYKFKSLFSILHSLFIAFLILYLPFSIHHSLFSILYSGDSIAKAENTINTEYEDNATTSLSITPSIHEEVVKPGQTTSKVFELLNNSKVPLPIKSYVRVFGASDELGGVYIEDESSFERFSPVNWTQVVDPDFIIQPGFKNNVTVNFNPPKDLPPGGYYLTLFFEPLVPESFLSESSINIGSRIGALLFLIGPGEIIEKGNLTSYKLPKLIWDSSVEAIIRFQNQGNIHFRSSGEIIVTNLITKNSWSNKVPEFTVLPGTIRQQATILDSIKWPGIYRSDLKIVYGNEKTVAKDTLIFYYLPFKSVLFAIILLVMVLAFVFPKSRRRLRRALKTFLESR